LHKSGPVIVPRTWRRCCEKCPYVHCGPQLRQAFCWYRFKELSLYLSLCHFDWQRS